MKFLKRNKNWDKPFSEKIAKRVNRIPTAELETYVDQSIYDIGRNMSTYARGRNAAYLDEALLASEVLHAIIHELNLRMSQK
jgi:hypothetical protein